MNPGCSNGTEEETASSGSTSIATLPPAPTSMSTTASDKEKSRLTEQEKKSNHIASEQKRRAAIREGFDRLTELVPGLEGQGRSESVVLKKTVEFMRLKLQERRDLVAEIERIGGHVDDSFRT
jgi:heteromeric Ino2p/Ino4p transcription factor